MIDTVIYRVTVSALSGEPFKCLFLQMPTVDEVLESISARIESLRKASDEETDQWDREMYDARVEALQLISEVLQFCVPLPTPDTHQYPVTVAGTRIGTVTVTALEGRTRVPQTELEKLVA